MADLPDAATCYELLARMALIRRFEEEAGRQYQRAKAGGFLHLAIGEEATIVGTASVMREEDYLIGTYRTHGHAIARGTDPKRVMAELFGRVDGTSGGRGGSMHIFDREQPLHGRLRDRRRQPADRSRPRPRLRVQGRRRGHRLHVRRRRLQRRQLRRDDEPGGAVEAAGLLPGREQPLRDGDLGRAALGPDRPLEEGRGLRHPGRADRRDGRAGGARGGRRGNPPRPRGAPADPAGGLHLPLPRPLRRRPGGLPRARGGRGVAREGPDRDLRPALRRGGRARRARGAGGAREGRAGGCGRGRVRRRLAGAAARHPLREPLRPRPDQRLVRGRRAQPAAAPRRAGGPDARRGPRAGRGRRRLRRPAGGAEAQPGGPRRRPGGGQPEVAAEHEEAES